jgi:hypothetical protein
MLLPRALRRPFPVGANAHMYCVGGAARRTMRRAQRNAPPSCAAPAPCANVWFVGAAHPLPRALRRLLSRTMFRRRSVPHLSCAAPASPSTHISPAQRASPLMRCAGFSLDHVPPAQRAAPLMRCAGFSLDRVFAGVARRTSCAAPASPSNHVFAGAACRSSPCAAPAFLNHIFAGAARFSSHALPRLLPRPTFSPAQRASPLMRCAGFSLEPRFAGAARRTSHALRRLLPRPCLRRRSAPHLMRCAGFPLNHVSPA